MGQGCQELGVGWGRTGVITWGQHKDPVGVLPGSCSGDIPATYEVGRLLS